MAFTARVTQDVIETVSLPTPDARVTQYTVELLSSAIVPARVTQYTVELLSENLVVPGAAAERVETYVWGPL